VRSLHEELASLTPLLQVFSEAGCEEDKISTLERIRAITAELRKPRQEVHINVLRTNDELFPRLVPDPPNSKNPEENQLLQEEAIRRFQDTKRKKRKSNSGKKREEVVDISGGASADGQRVESKAGGSAKKRKNDQRKDKKDRGQVAAGVEDQYKKQYKQHNR
jgi:hypothetical protein